MTDLWNSDFGAVVSIVCILYFMFVILKELS